MLDAIAMPSSTSCSPSASLGMFADISTAPMSMKAMAAPLSELDEAAATLGGCDDVLASGPPASDPIAIPRLQRRGSALRQLRSMLNTPTTRELHGPRMQRKDLAVSASPAARGASPPTVTMGMTAERREEAIFGSTNCANCNMINCTCGLNLFGRKANKESTSMNNV